MNPFYAYLYRLRLIRRWGLMQNAVPENVAEHSFHVALLTHALCTIAVRVFGKEVPVERAVLLALYHDATEVITGDIPSPVKHHNRTILQGFRELESLAAERLCEMVPGELRESYRPFFRDPDPELLRWVKGADLLDAYLKCVIEIAAGNREFLVAKREIEERIRRLKMPEVDYFLEHFGPSFEKSLDELAESEESNPGINAIETGHDGQ
ncbi:5'-deoxynucleotidase [Planifilum fulgidum]|jgi:5'-deoxynucleotidase|uniref:5'-deoxynucleotidase n=1 Tax=Planifilum fulgidum TaxID=201973 RepID=A0A1I2QVL3_9BACL|nr:5'-deoxynucleotidase [Planifilum fulgidum]MBO2496045.1 5'-deoxynucleotidase [Bacillota bacterium]MBO2533606.1 5'-deoxynucleotidase [Thermoactinomycetaceae bacterium]SFG30317.1 5'-deoxynucleotidase [Planifilum fulgidum]